MPWHPSFATHVPDLDAQHQYFVKLLDQLDVACQMDDRAKMDVILAELRRYAHYHFASEELLMAAYDYSPEKQHAEHSQILARLDEMLQDHSVSRAKIQVFLYKWLTNHMPLDDFEFAAHVLERRKPFLSPADAAAEDTPGAPEPRLTVVHEDNGRA